MRNTKEFKIIFDKDAYNREKTDTSINSSNAIDYDKNIYESNKIVEELDRFDLFENLKIDIDEYKAPTANSKYGIHYDSTVHSGKGRVILPHQETGAKRFLKELRGFGLLADVVGSGKTYEAGIVLSELAARGYAKSLLVIVPSQVFETWIEVLEKKFGMGVGAFKQVRYSDDNPNSANEEFEELLNASVNKRPNKPVIIDTEAFNSLLPVYTQLIFDVVIVDEAHNLSLGDDNNSMFLLSKLMETKRNNNVPYCVLLSATPHSGNLENMFKLWYFIRTKGGAPEDFKPNSRTHSLVYDKELEEYTNHICRGAHTVSEFIENCRREIILMEFKDDFIKYITTAKSFKGNFDELSFAEQKTYINEYYYDKNDGVYFNNLRKEQLGSSDMYDPISYETSRLYYALLRTIMIRQKNQLSNKHKKNIVNSFFYPVEEYNPIVEIKLADFKANKIEICVNMLSNFDAKSVKVDDETISFNELYNRYSRTHSKTFNQFYTDIMFNYILNSMEDKHKSFNMRNSLTYYQYANNKVEGNDLTNNVVFYNGSLNSLFEAKYNKLKEIINQNIDKRILIFLDYDVDSKNNVLDILEESIKRDYTNKKLIIGGGANKDKIIEEFNNDSTSILLIADQSFTEGANLQKCNIIVNFQVTYDPLSMDQRIGRIFRLGQENNVTIYSLANMLDLEGYILMYFSAIGLLSINGGDATILAGANSERMVAIRCNRCKRVKLMSKDDYDQAKKFDRDSIYCGSPSCMKYADSKSRGHLMEEITIYDFKCDKCNRVFTRSFVEEGYLCISDVEGTKGVMCNSGASNDRKIYCNKICAMRHCSYLKSINCKVLKLYQNPELFCDSVTEEIKNIKVAHPSDTVLDSVCKSCDNYQDCKIKGCVYEAGSDAIKKCHTCFDATCRPRPHVLNFDENWYAKCPSCESNRVRGTLKPTVAKTFATYVKNLWDFSTNGGDDSVSGAGFCDNLRNEIEKVKTIDRILSHDEEEIN